MDLHIYDIKLDPEGVVILSGKIEPDEAVNFAGYVKVLNGIFNNPVVYVPDDFTLDHMSEDEIKQLLKDALTIGSLKKLFNIVSNALSEKLEDIANEV